MDKYVKNMIASCVSCQYNDKTAKTAPASLAAGGSWEKVAVDITFSVPHGTAVMQSLSHTITVSGQKWHLPLLSLQRWLFAF